MMAEKKPLTDRQREVLTHVQKHIDEFLMPPTRRELAESLGMSENGANDHILALVRKGHMELLPGKSRGMRVLK